MSKFSVEHGWLIFKCARILGLDSGRMVTDDFSDQFKLRFKLDKITSFGFSSKTWHEYIVVGVMINSTLLRLSYREGDKDQAKKDMADLEELFMIKE